MARFTLFEAENVETRAERNYDAGPGPKIFIAEKHPIFSAHIPVRIFRLLLYVGIPAACARLSQKYPRQKHPSLEAISQVFVSVEINRTLPA